MAETDAPDLTCGQQECEIHETGRCLEGFATLAECPYFGKKLPHIVSPATEGPAEETEPVPKDVPLPEGRALTASGATRLVRSALTRVVVLAGDVESGKTTLAASLYDRFQEGPYAGLLFAGSLTLAGFEERCHTARMASQRMRPATLRTSTSEDFRFLHLRLRRAQSRFVVRDLLITDLSGERYRLARDSSEEVKLLTALRRADHVALLVDGAQLLRPETRHEAATNPQALLRSCLDEGMLDTRNHVQVVFSKWDLVSTGPTASDAIRFIEDVVTTAFRRFEHRLGSLEFVRVAARPDRVTGVLTPVGLDQLLDAWLDEARIAPTLPLRLALAAQSSREFDQYLWKHPELVSTS